MNIFEQIDNKPISPRPMSVFDQIDQSSVKTQLDSYNWQPPSAQEEALIPKTGPFENILFGEVAGAGAVARGVAPFAEGIIGSLINPLTEVGTEEIRKHLPEGKFGDYLAVTLGVLGTIGAGASAGLMGSLRGTGEKVARELSSKEIRSAFEQNREIGKPTEPFQPVAEPITPTEVPPVNLKPTEAPYEYRGEIRKPVAESVQTISPIETKINQIEDRILETPGKNVRDIEIEKNTLGTELNNLYKQTEKTSTINPETDSLADFVRKSGGLSTKNEFMKGEIKDRFTIKEGYNLVNNKTGSTLDEMRQKAQESGYIQEGSTVSDFLDMLRQDVDSKLHETPNRIWSTQRQNFEELITNLIGGGAGGHEGVYARDLYKSEVNLGRTGNIANAAKESIDKLAETEASQQGRRLYRQVAEALDKGDIEVEYLPEMLKKYNINMSDFVNEYRDTISTSARKLQQLSALRKHLNRLAETGRHPELEGLLDKLPSEPDSFWHRLMYGWGKWPGFVKIDNIRRASLVSQLATTMRNVESQTGSFGLHVLDKTLEKSFGGPKTIEPAEYISSFFNAMKSGEKDRIVTLLDKFPIEQQRLLNTPTGEVTLGSRYTRFLNTLNNMQESFFRRAVFDASLREQLRQKNFDILEMMNNPREIPHEYITRAVNDALDITFAQMPKQGTFGAAVLKAYKAIPPLTLVNPFPRFLANSYRFLMEHSPAGYLKLLEKTPQGEMLFKNPETRAKILAKATTGTLLLSGALAIRMSDIGGEKWYQIKVGDKNMDMRPFAPFSTYLFMAEAMKEMSETGIDVIKNGKDLQTAMMKNGKLTTQDIVQGVISINRIAGTGLVAVDLLRSGTVSRKMDILRDLLAQYMGGFTVPFKTIKDAVSVVSEEEVKMRDTRDTLLAPAMTNIPGASKLYPEAVSPVEKETPQTEYPVLRQLTGISLSQAKPLREEINRLGLEPMDYLPQTGFPVADREISKIMRTRIDTILMPTITGKEYLSSDNATKKLLLTEIFSLVKRNAFQDFKKVNPKLALEIYKKGLDKDIKAFIMQKGTQP